MAEEDPTVHRIVKALTLIGNTLRHYERDDSLCPLCGNTLQGDQTRLVVASEERNGVARRHALWACHMGCFNMAADRQQ
jgi:5-methylcytosine-specific restriction endonuclease McrA